MSAFAGLLLAFAFPTEPDHPLAWMHNSMWGFVSLLPLFRCLPLPKWKDGFQIGWIMGSVFSLYSLYWVAYTQGGGLAVVGGTLLMAAYIGLFYGIAIGFLNIVVNRFASAGWFSAPFFWTGIEYLLSLGELGFPWLLLGITQAETIELIQYAEITGVYGVSFWVVLVNAVLWLFFTSVNLVKLSVGAFVLALLFALPWYYSFRVMDKTDPSETIRVGLVQNNIGLEKWQYGGLEQSFSSAESLSRKAAKQAPEIIVWPETAIPALPGQISPFIAALAERARRSGTTLLSGILTNDGQQHYNSLLAIGAIQRHYRKHHLVPFGEYLPAAVALRPILEALGVTVSEFSRGPKMQMLLEVAGYPIGTSICYEAVFSEEIIRPLPDAAWLVNVSNDAWFGDSLAPHQHLEIAQMRSLETARYMVRSTNTGISAVIDARGEIMAKSPQFQTDVLVADVQPMVGATLFVIVGNWLIVSLCAVAVLLVGVRSHCPRKGGDSVEL